MQQIGVAAPGGGVASDESSGVYGAQANGSYVRLSGTSMAAPHVTGLVSTVIDRFLAYHLQILEIEY